MRAQVKLSALFGSPVQVVARWYAMAGRFAQEAARSRRDEKRHVIEGA